MKAHEGAFRVRLMCRVLSVSVSGYYAWRGRKPSSRAQRRAARDAQVQEAFVAQKGREGSPRLSRRLGVGRRQVAQSLRRQGLRAKAAKAYRKFKRPFRPVCRLGRGRATAGLGTDRSSLSGIPDR